MRIVLSFALLMSGIAVAQLPEMLDLETAQRQALTGNPSLQAVAERVEQARQRVNQSRSAFLPQVALGYSASHTELSDNYLEKQRLQSTAIRSFWDLLFGPSTIPFDDSVDNFSINASVSWLVFNGFAREYTHQMARYGAKESEAGQRDAQRLLLQGVAQSFYGVQLAREALEITEADEAFNARLLKESKARQNAGTGSLSDVLNFEVLIRASQARTITAERELENARIILATLMGVEEGRLDDLVRIASLEDVTAEEIVLPEADPQINYALAHRPDIDRSQWATERTEAGVMAQRGAFYPSVALFGSYDGNRIDDTSFESDDFSSTVGLSISYDIFTGGYNRARLREAKHAQREANWLLKDAEIQVKSAVHQALTNLEQAQAQLTLQEDTEQYVRKNRELVEKEYNAGQTDLARLNQAQRDLIAAESRLAQAHVGLRFAWHQLDTETGRILENFATLR